MPKYKVCVGRLVRETATVIVSAPTRKILEANLGLVYEGCPDASWEADTEWGCEESDSHVVLGSASPRSKVEVIIKEGE